MNLSALAPHLPNYTEGNPQISHNRHHEHQAAEGEFKGHGSRRPRSILGIIAEEVPLTPIAFVVEPVYIGGIPGVSHYCCCYTSS